MSLLDTVTNTLNTLPKLIGLVSAIEKVNQLNPYEEQAYQNQSLTTEEAQQMWTEQCVLNFPLLYLASLCLYLYAEQRGCDFFLFATRDCCHWVRIFKAMFPQTKAHYFHCSRNMFSQACRNLNPAYNEYVTNLITSGDNRQNLDEAINRTIFVDLHGSGEHVFRYFRKNFHAVPNVFLLSSTRVSYQKLPSICRDFFRSEKKIKTLIFGFNGGPIEMINYDRRGTLQGFNRQGQPIRDPLEYPKDLIIPYHRCIDFLVDHLLPIPTVNLDQRYHLDELVPLMKVIYEMIHKTQSIVRRHAHHIGRHQKVKTKIDH